MMDTQGPPEEFYVELTECLAIIDFCNSFCGKQILRGTGHSVSCLRIHAEGAEGKKNPPVLANSGCCASDEKIGLGRYINFGPRCPQPQCASPVQGLVWILSESDGVTRNHLD